MVQVHHPVMPAWLPVHGVLHAKEKGCSPELGYADLVRLRHEAIQREQAFPLQYGWEPPIWWVCDCLLGFPWVPALEAEKLRRLLGFEAPLRTLLIMGGNRGGKSEYAAKRMSRILWERPGARVWLLHSTESMSRQYQQPLMHRYMPPELRMLKKPLQTATAYVSYKQQTGFSDKHFVLPNRSECSFLCYEMDRKHVEGGNVDGINPDELVPWDWVETMELRLAERQGKMIVTFTPVEGYSGTVAGFLDGSEVVKWSTSFLCPTDGKEPRPDLECGLSLKETAEMEAWMTGGPGRSVWARPEDCRKWEKGQFGGRPSVAENEGQPACPPGRAFEVTPRVARCASAGREAGLRGVVWFRSSDNPYGNPLSVWSVVKGRSRVFIRERFNGVADKQAAVKFPLFDERVHGFDPGEEPRDGTWWMYVDPCGGRNWFMLWVLSTPESDWVMQEWPSQVDPIPGIGVLGPWAIPDGKLIDGKRGEGQKTLGWGLLQYKAEIARIEGWMERPQRKGVDREDDESEMAEKLQSELDRIRDWQDPVAGVTRAKWRVFERVIDSRFSGARIVGEDRLVTLIEELNDVNLQFVPATAVGASSDGKTPIGEGIQLLNNALYYNREKPVGFGNRPRLRICRKCKNLIFALKTWTNASGESATKDPIDVLRMHYQHGGGWIDESELNTVTGGGHY